MSTSCKQNLLDQLKIFLICKHFLLKKKTVIMKKGKSPKLHGSKCTSNVKKCAIGRVNAQWMLH